MLERQSLFASTKDATEEFYAQHFPDRLYALFLQINLIKPKRLEIKKSKETFLLEITQEIIGNDKKPDAACFAIKHTSSLSATSTMTTYIFVNKNAYRSDYIGEDNLDYVGENNSVALLWPDNFLCRDKTIDTVNIIVKTLENIDSQLVEDIYLADCTDCRIS